MSTRAPVMFIGHGSPMFAVEPGKPGELMREFSTHFVDVEAVLIISPALDDAGIGDHRG